MRPGLFCKNERGFGLVENNLNLGRPLGWEHLRCGLMLGLGMLIAGMLV